ncbi:MAG: DUF4430 domain-containing protein [Clostridiaceae bacterium]|nr:DUF4430 domain-containing protein [Clostridiaceae bacterium]
MRKIRFWIGVLLSFSLLTGLLGCSGSSDENTNFEKQSAVITENVKKDQIESNQTTDRKSEIQAEKNSEKTDDTKIKSKQDKTINDGSESNTIINSTNNSEKINTKIRKSSTDDITLKDNSSDTLPTHQTTTLSDQTSVAPTVTETQTKETSAARTTPATTTPTTTTTLATTEAVPDTVRVQISVDCINAYNAGNEIAQAISSDGWILGATVYEMPKNSTVYDLLMATGLVIGSTTSSLGVYVYSIQSLAEFALGGSSGWIYTVNGSMPSVGVDSYILQPGDFVHFSYTVELGDI